MMDQRLLDADTIVFDIGNVLLGFNAEKIAPLLPEADREPLLEAMFGPPQLWGQFDLGADSNETIARRIADAAHLPGREKEVLDLLHHFPEVMDPLPLYGLLPELRKMGKRLYALSNYPEPSFSLTALRFPFLTECLDGAVVSSREKKVKPDPEFFRLLCGRYSLVPEKCLFIDDLKANVDAAAREGFRTWHYTGIG